MRTSRASFILAAALLAACGGGRSVAGFKQGAMPAGYTWTGKYFCDFFGTMDLTQSGSTVVGTVEYASGRIEGTANGNILVFSWTQKSGPEGLGAQKLVTGRGVFQYSIAKAGGGGSMAHNVKGVWGYEQSQTDGGQWNCYKSKKDILKVQKQLLVNEEGAVAAAEESSTATTEPTAEEEEEGTTLKGVGAKKKKTTGTAPKTETQAPETGDERLEDLDDL